MKTLAVFDPALSYFDPVLVQFVADLKWVEKLGVKVSRHNLGKEPQAFAANPAVVKEMEAGMDRLPVIMVDGRIVSTGMYPTRQQLAQKLGIAATPEEISPVEAAGCCCTPKFGCY
ncbi:MAG: arsenic metallochaperone ArsD family protein [Gallionella sp.]|nr:arsenic metallochaperone ArsD family protein [Gallionella sp.]